MYLKSIEIHGFKSFANKIVFRFHNGITGIVGPNGSGKSNVADAVRWVLGEQRIKQLRGASMQDVIFSGTEMRKPLGYAYVAITLDNGDHQLAIDYDEVTVARRIYRSGESEYLLNGTPCRLKDVNELFYDTGIGKEGYSIIGQGQIEKILSGKPEERRELFDEAAGIVKFKRRKTAAQKKLEDEKQNLLRVEYFHPALDLLVFGFNPFVLFCRFLQIIIGNAVFFLKDKEEIDGQLAKVEKARDEARSLLNLVQNKIEELNNNIESGKNTIIDALNSRATIKSKIGRFDTMMEQVNIRKASVKFANASSFDFSW